MRFAASMSPKHEFRHPGTVFLGAPPASNRYMKQFHALRCPKRFDHLNLFASANLTFEVGGVGCSQHHAQYTCNLPRP